MKLTHITGKSVTEEIVTDELAGISLNNTIKVERIVEVKELDMCLNLTQKGTLSG